MSKPTMTLREVQMDLRERGIKKSAAAISKGIKCGLFPFGSVTNIGDTGRATFLILRVDYENWADRVAQKV